MAHAPMVPVITPGVSVWSSRLRICSMKAWMPLSVKDPSEFGSRSEAYTTACVAVRPIHPGHHLHKTTLSTRDNAAEAGPNVLRGRQRWGVELDFVGFRDERRSSLQRTDVASMAQLCLRVCEENVSSERGASCYSASPTYNIR